jgi:leucyl/phenylalanyl-tRNA---protein transferase
MPVFIPDDLIYFPPYHEADEEGLIAITTDFSIPRILLAYQSGIFPWFQEDDMFFWYAPEPRCVLYPNNLIVSASMRKVIKDDIFRWTFNEAFHQVMLRCASINRRPVVLNGIVHANDGTWINQFFFDAYSDLHNKGLAISAECWLGNELVGGLYGVKLGNIFYGESMFAEKSNASKFAFIKLIQHLQQHGLAIVDCQTRSAHLVSLGAETISGKQFLSEIKQHVDQDYALLHASK